MDLVLKALTSLAIEKSLLKIGKPAYEKAISMLEKKYQCHMPDCYEHPEYLNDVLKEIFGKSHTVIVNEIRQELVEFLHKRKVGRFVQVISQ